MAKVSIIVPIYNTEKYLRQALESCVNQTLADIEIICIEDCSTDGSPQILEEFAQKDSRIKILKPDERITTGKARNWAMDVAQGDYIMFLDSDDWLELNACELAYEQIFKNKNDMVLFEQNLYYEKDNTYKPAKRLCIFTEQELANPQLEIKNIGKNIWYSGEAIHFKIYDKDFLLKNKIYFTDTVSAEDIPFVAKSVLFAKTISTLQVPLCNFRKHRTTAPRRVVERWFDFFENWNVTYEIFKQYGEDEYFKKCFISKITKRVIGRYSYISQLDKTIAQDVYVEIQKFIKMVSHDYELSKFKDLPFWDMFLISNINNHFVYNLLIKLISIQFSVNRISLCILGIRIRLKRNT